MKTFDNNGKLIGEINHSRTADGTSITSNTLYNNGRPVNQNITVRQPNGKISITNVLNGKLLP